MFVIPLLFAGFLISGNFVRHRQTEFKVTLGTSNENISCKIRKYLFHNKTI